MALGFWKQRALSSDVFSENATDSFKSAKESSPRDGDERPSSGDSGISECPLIRKSVQMKSEDDSQPIIKMEPGEAVNRTSDGSAHADILTVFSCARSQNKENTEPAQLRAAAQKRSSARNAASKVSARNQESRRKAIKQEEVTSDFEILTNSNGGDSLRTRRIEANARERSRVHTIGAAFEALRQTVPSNCDQQKLSKLAILRIATAYIRALTSLLENNSAEFAIGVEQCTQALLLDGVRSKYPKTIP